MQSISNMYEYLKRNIYKSSKKIYKKIKGIKRKRERGRRGGFHPN